MKPRNPTVKHLLGRNRVHKDRKHAIKRERVNNAAIWRIINTGV